MLLATVLQSRAIVKCLHKECCLPATEVGDDGALEIILKYNHYKYLFQHKIWNTTRHKIITKYLNKRSNV